MPAPMHLDLETEVRDLFLAKLQELADFCRDHWQMTEQDMREFTRPIRSKTVEDAFREGYNAALTDGLTGAIECWGEEMGYT